MIMDTLDEFVFIKIWPALYSFLVRQTGKPMLLVARGVGRCEE